MYLCLRQTGRYLRNENCTNCYVQYHAETSFHGFNLFTRLFVYKNKTITFYWFCLDSYGDQNGWMIMINENENENYFEENKMKNLQEKWEWKY